MIGLAVYGYKIIQVLGNEMAKVTPSRGFAIELGAVAVIIMGTRLGIPLSTTHCQVGATCGVAHVEGRGGVNYKTWNRHLRMDRYSCCRRFHFGYL